MTHIYALIDPRDRKPRYVGVSRNVPLRLNQHLVGSRYGRTAKDRWICELRAVGMVPEAVILESTTAADALDRESAWIDRYRTDGLALTNNDHAPWDAARRAAATARGQSVHKSTLMRRVEREQRMPLEAVIQQMLAEGLSTPRMARLLDVSYWTMRNWLELVEKERTGVGP
jgi:DNA-binding transcriptional regulator YiaG